MGPRAGKTYHFFRVCSCLRRTWEKKGHKLPGYLNSSKPRFESSLRAKRCCNRLTSVGCTQVGSITWVENDSRHLFPTADCCWRSSRQAVHFLVPAVAELIIKQKSELLYGMSNRAGRQFYGSDQKCMQYSRQRHATGIKSKMVSSSSLKISQRAGDISSLQDVN